MGDDMKQRLQLLGLLAGCAASALASAALADPPGRVGRISDVDGEVSFQPPEGDFWTVATRNYPVAPGEAFWTGDSGRVELEVGAIEAWLDSQSELDVVDLDYGETRLSLAQGSMDLRIHRVPRGGVRVETPVGEVRIDYVGLYRIDVGAPQDDGSYPEVELTVFEGEAGAPGPNGLIRVDAGEGALIDAGYAPQIVDIQYAAIDDWARDREARERWSEREDSAEFTGSEGLGQFGQFVDTGDYGQVWFPSEVPADWAPYRYGHWAYVSPWGWTWIDDQPWGFAPFHYGRWARIDGRWGWVRGQPAPEPVYAPALVAFVGGRGWSIGLGVGGGGSVEAMGWVPLAPDEVFRPTYQVSDRYIRQVNVANVRQTTINNITVNNTAVNTVTVNQYRNAPAATVVRADAFARGAPVQRSVAPVSVQALAAAPLMTVASRPAPTPEARTGVGARPNVGPQRLGAAPGVVAAAPPPARLQAVRAAVAAQPLGAVRPPPIAGASLAPPRPRPEGRSVAGLIAPAQARQPAPRPAMPGSANTPPALARTPPAMPGAPAVNANANAQAASQAEARARSQAAAQAQANAQREAAARAAQGQAQAHAAEQARAQAAAAEQQAAAARQAQTQAQAQAQANAQREAAARAAQAQARAQAEARMQAEQRAQAQARQAGAAKPKAPPPAPDDAKRRKPEKPESPSPQ
jgi:hypothetical protein